MKLTENEGTKSYGSFHNEETNNLDGNGSNDGQTEASCNYIYCSFTFLINHRNRKNT